MYLSCSFSCFFFVLRFCCVSCVRSGVGSFLFGCSVPSARVDGGDLRDTDIGEMAAVSMVLGCESDLGKVGPEVGGF